MAKQLFLPHRNVESRLSNKRETKFAYVLCSVNFNGLPQVMSFLSETTTHTETVYGLLRQKLSFGIDNNTTIEFGSSNPKLILHILTNVTLRSQLYNILQANNE